MKKLTIIGICFLALFVLSVCEGAKTYKNQTKDSEVRTRDAVVVVISEPVVNSRTITLRQFKSELEREKTRRDNHIASVIVMEAELALLQAEADKIVLKLE